MRFCVKCGEPLEKGKDTCGNCGAKVKFKKYIEVGVVEEDENKVAEIAKKKTVKAYVSVISGTVFIIAFLMAGLRMLWEPAKATPFREMVAYALNIWWAIAIVSCKITSLCSGGAIKKVNGKQLLTGASYGCAKFGNITASVAIVLCFLWFAFICFLGVIWLFDGMFEMWRPSVL